MGADADAVSHCLNQAEVASVMEGYTLMDARRRYFKSD